MDRIIENVEKDKNISIEIEDEENVKKLILLMRLQMINRKMRAKAILTFSLVVKLH